MSSEGSGLACPSEEQPSEGQPSDDAPELRQITDARTLRALAHPVRMALMEELIYGGAMTATEVGERIGESPTTCSFHLRQLAKYGFVEEAGGGRGRARPWRLTSIGFSFVPGQDPEADIAAGAALRMFRERQFARYRTWLGTNRSYPLEWRKAAGDGAFFFYLTVEELERLNGELEDLLMRWFRYEGRLEDPSKRPPDSVPVEMLVVSYPLEPPAVDRGDQPPEDGDGDG
jgi:DNA-binding transcriptional ArsR family regulator